MTKNRILFFLTLGLACGCHDRAASDFQEVKPGRIFSFPEDHGSHPSFKTEWWYFTGQLFLDQETIFKKPADFGFQLTFFRSSRGTNDADDLMAHAALTKINDNKFLHEQRFSLARSGLGSVALQNFAATIQDWNGAINPEGLSIQYRVRECQVDLSSINLPQVLLQGKNGYSKKSFQDKKASYYYSIPRIPLKGSVACDGQPRQKVRGFGWMDHEFMSEALSETQSGWDWISLTTDKRQSLMLFRLRGKNPEDSYLSGTLHNESTGTTIELGKDDFTIETVSTWKSESSDALYPSEIKVSVPSHGIVANLLPLVKDQEIISSSDMDIPSYWEGAVSTSDNSTFGYVELTGYDRAMIKKF